MIPDNTAITFTNINLAGNLFPLGGSDGFVTFTGGRYMITYGVTATTVAPPVQVSLSLGGVGGILTGTEITSDINNTVSATYLLSLVSGSTVQLFNTTGASITTASSGLGAFLFVQGMSE